MKTRCRGLAIGLILTALPVLATVKMHDGKTNLKPDEVKLVEPLTEKNSTGFSVIWKSPDMKEFGLLKWNEDSSSAVTDAPDKLLDSVRENMGRINQKSRKGEPLFISFTVYKYKKQGFVTNPVAYFEIVARTKDGKPAWIAIDSIKTSQSMAESIADTDSAIIGREVFRKLREEFNM